MNRRQFISTGAAGVASAVTATSLRGADSNEPSASKTKPSTEWARNFGTVPMAQHGPLRAKNEAARAQDARPNILFIYTDQQTFSALSAVGNPWLRTPQMDLLARHGVSFERSYCPAPICGPSRGSLAYGRLPHETGVRYNSETPHPDLPNLGTSLRDAGYDTTWTGKWHLPDSYPKSSEIPGFHYLTKPKGLEGSFLGDSVDMHFSMRAGAYLRWHAGLSAKPWFLGISLHNPHDICHYFIGKDKITGMPEPDLKHIDTTHLPPLPENHAPNPDEAEYLTNRRHQKSYGSETGNYGTDLSDAHWRAYLQQYYSMTEAVDRCLSPILQGLEAGGWSDNTLIVFTSDHGEGVAAHQWFTKLTLYEETLRVPFIAVPPGTLGKGLGRTDSEHIVSGLDLMPTCLDYAGVQPKESPAKLRGRSLRSLIEYPKSATAQSDWREVLVVPIDLSPDRPDEVGRALITADGWKYHTYSGGKNAENLYNLNTDPGETTNLAAQDSDQLNRCRALIEGHCKATADPFRLQSHATL